MRSILVISGLDPGGGAGFIADVRVCEASGCRAVGTPATLTVQNSQGLVSHQPIDADLLEEQLTTLLCDVQVHAVKLGALGNVANAKAIAKALNLTSAPCVWDPVLGATQGGPLLDLATRDDLDAIVDTLLPHVLIVTPTASEASHLTRTEASADAPSRLHELAKALRARGFEWSLLKGGDVAHQIGADFIEDILIGPDGAPQTDRIARQGRADLHGTGCALSSALACALAQGLAVPAAVQRARTFVQTHAAAPVHAGRGRASIV